MNKIFAFTNFRRVVDYNRFLSMKITAEGKDIPKKKIFESRITLIGHDNSVSITDLKSAQSLSVRRDLKLVKIQDIDTKTRRPVYKLLTSAQYLEEEIAKRKEKKISKENQLIKGQKLITLSNRIAENDLMTSVKKMIKLLDKQFEVKVVVTGSDSEAAESLDKICSVIEKNTKSSGKMIQKRNKGNSLRFQLIPVRDKSSQVGNDNSSNNSDNKGDEKAPL